MSADTAETLVPNQKTGWMRCLVFLFLHLACFSVYWVGWSWIAVGVAFVLYAVRAFALTGFYHRYFSHRAFKTSRWFQCVWAFIGCSAAQRGAIWWAAHHRDHHRFSDEERDVHSPRQHGFWWSHMLWFMTDENFKTKEQGVRDLLKLPELKFIDNHDYIPPLALAASVYGLGAILEHYAPQLGTNGLQMLVWGFLISTVFLYHVTYAINSLAHVWGSRRYETTDDSRNNFLLALFAMGEGWHNNHHHYPASARNGFFWWEIDVTYYTLVVFSWLGLVSDLKPVPAHVLAINGDVELPTQVQVSDSGNKATI